MIAARKLILRVIAASIYNAWAMPVVDLPDEAATVAFAARISALAEIGDVIALKGDLGAGKTTFARAFIRARGGTEEVPSPTFTLVQVYELGSAAIWHFDLYRLTSPEEVWELGFEEALIDGIILIEWPERIGALLPRERLDLTLAAGAAPQARVATLQGSAGWSARLGQVFANG